MIEYSVRMPMFRVKYIAWLALESLCRQKGVTFEWELVMAEEQIGNEIFGLKIQDVEDQLIECFNSRFYLIDKNLKKKFMSEGIKNLKLC